MGDVYVHDNFRFSDGTTGKKLFILLNNPTGTEPLLTLKTTSKLKYPPYTPGCNQQKNVYYIPKNSDWFYVDTLVQLEEIFEISFSEFQNSMILYKNIRHCGPLSSNEFRSLLACLKKNREDISEEHFKLIYG